MYRFVLPLSLLLTLLLTLPLSAQVAEPIDEIDGSSYESLFRAALHDEQSMYGMRNPNFFANETLDAIATFHQIDLLFTAVSPYQTDQTQSPLEQLSARYGSVSLAQSIAERLFRAGRIDDGIAFLQKILPPQDEADGMLAAGYVSESLLEQKRFDLAWQIADSGSSFSLEHADNIRQYILRTLAKNYPEKVSTHYTKIPRLPPYVPNEADAEIYRTEADRALEQLLKLPEKITDDRERGMMTQYVILNALAALGRSDEAYALAENDQIRVSLLRTILKERVQNGTQEEVDQWFQKVRQFYDDGKVSGGFDTPPATTFIWYCLDAGKYLDAMDAIESHGSRDRGIVGSPSGYFGRIPELNVETDFRYNSKELLDRLIKHHEVLVKDPGNFGQRNHFQFYQRLIKAQLNLGLLDDALESLRKITSSLEALESLGDIAFYAVKNKEPEEASHIEAAAIGIFQDVEEVKKNDMGNFYLVDFFVRLAVRFMKEGEAEKGAAYLKTALDKAEEVQRRNENESRRRINAYSQMEGICGILVVNDYLDEAAQIAGQIESRYLMPEIHLSIAEKQAEAGEAEKAKSALRKAFEQISQIRQFFHPLDYTTYARMASLAVKLEDKELFYEIMNVGMQVAEQQKWYDSGYGSSDALGVFVRQLAVYGDEEHPLFVRAEEAAEGFKEMNKKADLYFSLGVSQ